MYARRANPSKDGDWNYYSFDEADATYKYSSGRQYVRLTSSGNQYDITMDDVRLFRLGYNSGDTYFTIFHGIGNSYYVDFRLPIICKLDNGKLVKDTNRMRELSVQMDTPEKYINGIITTTINGVSTQVSVWDYRPETDLSGGIQRYPVLDSFNEYIRASDLDIDMSGLVGFLDFLELRGLIRFFVPLVAGNTPLSRYVIKLV